MLSGREFGLRKSKWPLFGFVVFIENKNKIPAHYFKSQTEILCSWMISATIFSTFLFFSWLHSTTKYYHSSSLRWWWWAEPDLLFYGYQKSDPFMSGLFGRLCAASRVIPNWVYWTIPNLRFTGTIACRGRLCTVHLSARQKSCKLKTRWTHIVLQWMWLSVVTRRMYVYISEAFYIRHFFSVRLSLLMSV